MAKLKDETEGPKALERIQRERRATRLWVRAALIQHRRGRIWWCSDTKNNGVERFNPVANLFKQQGVFACVRGRCVTGMRPPDLPDHRVPRYRFCDRQMVLVSNCEELIRLLSVSSTCPGVHPKRHEHCSYVGDGVPVFERALRTKVAKSLAAVLDREGEPALTSVAKRPSVSRPSAKGKKGSLF